MGLIGQLRWSLRHCRKRLFESVLIIFAVGLGIAVIVSIIALIGSARAQLRAPESSEWMRTFRVYSAAHFHSSSGREPVLQVVQERPTEPLQVPLNELKVLQDALPEGMHVFVEQTYSFPTRLLPKTQDESEAPLGQYESLVPSSGGAYVRFSQGAVAPTGTAVTIEVNHEEELEADGGEQPVVEKVESFTRFDQLYEQYDSIYITGTTPEYFDFKQYEIAQGNLFFDDDLINGSEVLVLSYKLAERLFGDTDPIGQRIPVELFSNIEQQMEFTVIGVLAPFTDEQEEHVFFGENQYYAYAPYTAIPHVRSLYSDQEILLDSFIIGVDYGVDLAWASEIINAEIEQRYGDLAVVSSSYISVSELNTSNSIYIIIAIFASLGLVIAVINILNLMLARVLRRTKSVGLSMALGSSKRGVFSQFLLEAVVLGLLGAVTGICFTYGLLKLLSKLLYTDISLDLISAASGFGLGLLVSLLFGVYPAYQASLINPVDALRND